MAYDDDRPENLPAGPVGDAIYVAAKKHGMDPRVLGGIASIESSFQPISNYNRPTQYKGLFQMGHDEWRQYGSGGNIYNAYDNADAAARMLSDHSDWFRHSYGREPSPAEVYMMHQQGRGFFSDGTMTNIGGNRYPGMWGPQNSSSFMNGWGRELERRMNGAPETARIPIDFSAFGSDPGEKKQPIDFAAFGKDPQQMQAPAQQPQAQQSKPIDYAAFGANPPAPQKLTDNQFSDLNGLGEAAQQLTPHANWNKFEREAMPSQNVEDKRDPDYTSRRQKREAPMMPESAAGEDTFASSDRTQDLSDIGLTVPKGGPLKNVPLPRVRPASAPQLPDQQRQALDISDAVPRRPGVEVDPSEYAQPQ
jgi:hypothetical protein